MHITPAQSTDQAVSTDTFRVEIRFDVTGTAADAWAVGRRAAGMFGGEITEVLDGTWQDAADIGERTSASAVPIVVIETSDGLIDAILSTDGTLPAPIVIIDRSDVPADDFHILPADEFSREEEIYVAVHTAPDHPAISPRLEALLRQLVADPQG